MKRRCQSQAAILLYAMMPASAFRIAFADRELQTGLSAELWAELWAAKLKIHFTFALPSAQKSVHYAFE